jgi:hypothetical protein
MAAAKPKFEIVSVPLGKGPPGSIIKFKIQNAPGFEANAILMRSTTVIATWESSELLGKQIAEPLVSKGIHTLQVTIVYTTAKLATADITFQLNNGPVVPVALTGKKPDVSRAIATARIV